MGDEEAGIFQCWEEDALIALVERAGFRVQGSAAAFGAGSKGS